MRRLYSSALGGTAAVVRNGSYVLDEGDVEACGLKCADCCFTSVAGTLNVNFYSLHAVIDCAFCCCFCCSLCCVRGVLSGALEALSTGGRPCDGVALYVSDSYDCVVESRADVCVTCFDILQ